MDVFRRKTDYASTQSGTAAASQIAIKTGVTMFWVCKALLRYRRNGTGPVAETLSADPAKREVELALVTRLTAALLEVLRPEVQP
ncbi:MAG: hypothetical protein Q7K57_48615 [Burkholderiaceae bacterium]|nr:hypothetical protein [Burkholderiaceae bacterium]